MAEQLYYDTTQAQWFIAEEEKIKESIEKLNHEIRDRGELNLYDIYAKINEDLPEGMKIRVAPICNHLWLEFDYPNDEEKSDYEPISLDAIESHDVLPMTIVLNFHEPRYRSEDL